LQASVIVPTPRCGSVLAENPTPTIGIEAALAVKVGIPLLPATVALKLAVWLVGSSPQVPEMVETNGARVVAERAAGIHAGEHEAGGPVSAG
jgi:hypothetical protein